MTLTPRQLLRFYPRLWRRRYGDEFLALLEATPITRALVIDVVRAAGREWLTGTLTMRVVIAGATAGAATACAVGLSRVVPVAPTMWVEGGQTVVAPPWPVSFGFLPPLLVFVAVARLLSALARPGRPILSFPLPVWLVALFLAAVGSQWGDLVSWLGTGIEPRPLYDIWLKSALQVMICLTQLFVADLFDNPLAASPPFRSVAPPTHPLGLGDRY